MSRDLSSGRESLTVEALERIDRICVHFEEEWRSGRRPRIEELVGDVLATERTDLFAELLMIELEYRRSRGEKPAVDEYKQRFPDACEQIDGLLGKSSQSDLLD